jgi:hypothetical protein
MSPKPPIVHTYDVIESGNGMKIYRWVNPGREQTGSAHNDRPRLNVEVSLDDCDETIMHKIQEAIDAT